MRTFITTATIASAAGAALLLAAAPANAAPDITARAVIGESCAGYAWGTLALDRNSGIVLTCTDDGTWQIPKSST